MDRSGFIDSDPRNDDSAFQEGADEPLAALRWQDELLQILYWMQGEGLGEAVTPQDLLPFLPADEASIQAHLERLAVNGYAVRLGESPVRYRLSQEGLREGGRRFADAFAGLTGQAHGECNNPECACHVLGPDACTSHPY